MFLKDNFITEVNLKFKFIITYKINKHIDLPAYCPDSGQLCHLCFIFHRVEMDFFS